MKKRIVETPDAPAAFGPYSQGVVCDNVLYLSGVLGIDPATGAMRSGLEAQIHQLFANMRGVVEAAGGTLADIVKLVVFLTDINDAAVLNDIMAQYFKAPFPARATVQVAALPKGALVEIDSNAVLANKPA